MRVVLYSARSCTSASPRVDEAYYTPRGKFTKHRTIYQYQKGFSCPVILINGEISAQHNKRGLFFL